METSNSITYAIYIDSPNISGAEKRAIKLFYDLNNSGQSCNLIISKRLFDAFQSSEYSKYFQYSYIVVDMGWLGELRKIKKFHLLRRFTGFNRILKKIYNFQVKRTLEKSGISNLVLHIFLDLDLAIKLKKVSPINKIIFEITSPDYIKKLLSNKIEKLNNINYFNAVSESVYIKAIEFISDSKLGKSPIPFFSPSEYIVNNEELFSIKENIIIFAHRLAPRKNGLLFAKVVKTFLQKYPNWIIKLFGKGAEATKINALLSEEIALGQVVTGYQTKILPELEKSKIFVSLIEPDNYPSQSVLEAMYTGNALLLSDTGFTKECFWDNNGLLCELTFEDVLLKLTRLVSGDIDLENCGRNSLNLLHSKYHKTIYLDYISRMYKLVSERPD